MVVPLLVKGNRMSKEISMRAIKRRLSEIEDEKMYSPNEIIDQKLVIDTMLKPSVYTLYRHIKRGVVPAVNLGTESAPRYFVKGKDLKAYLKKRYGFA